MIFPTRSNFQNVSQSSRQKIPTRLNEEHVHIHTVLAKNVGNSLLFAGGTEDSISPVSKSPTILVVTDVNGTILNEQGFRRDVLEVLKKWTSIMPVKLMFNTGKALFEMVQDMKKDSEGLNALAGLHLVHIGDRDGSRHFHNSEGQSAQEWLSNLKPEHQVAEYKNNPAENLVNWDVAKVRDIINEKGKNISEFKTKSPEDPKFYLKASPERLLEIERTLIPEIRSALKELGMNADIEEVEVAKKSDAKAICKKYTVFPTGISKATSVKHAASVENLGHVITMGNGQNDVPMFRVPSYGNVAHTAIIYKGEEKGLDTLEELQQPHCTHLGRSESLGEGLDKVLEKIHEDNGRIHLS